MDILTTPIPAIWVILLGGGLLAAVYVMIGNQQGWLDFGRTTLTHNLGFVFVLLACGFVAFIGFVGSAVNFVQNSGIGDAIFNTANSANAPFIGIVILTILVASVWMAFLPPGGRTYNA